MNPAAFRQHWQQLSRAARLYLLHATLLTGSLAIYGLFFNLIIPALGYPRAFLGQLNGLAIGVAAVLSLPLWWFVTRIGLTRSLIISALLQGLSAIIIAAWPTTPALLIAVALIGAAATITQVSVAPFMMVHSDAETRDYLFSANTAITIGVAGIGTLLAGILPALFAGLLGVGSEHALAYRATFGVAGVGAACSLVPLLLIHESSTERPRTSDDSPPPQDASSPPLDDSSRMTRLRARLPANIQGVLAQPWPVIKLMISPMLISFGAALLIQYLNLFFKDRFMINDRMLGLIFALLGIATGVATLVGPTLSARIGKIRTIVVTQALSLPFLLLMGFAPLLGVAVGAALLRGALFNMGAPLYDAFAMEQIDESLRPTVIGLMGGAATTGFLVSPIISTWVQDRYGFGPLFVTAAIFYGLAAAANYLLFMRHDSRKPIAPHAE